MDLNSFLQLINSCLYHQDPTVRNQSTQTFFQLMEQDPIGFLQFIILSLQSSANTTQEQKEIVSIIIRKHIYQYHVNSVVVKAIVQQRSDLALQLLETLLQLITDNAGSTHVYADSAAEVLCHIMSESPQAIQLAFCYLDKIFQSTIPKVRHAGGHIVQMLFDCGFDKSMELNQQIFTYLSILMESDDMKLNQCAVQGICNLLSATEYRDTVMENEYELKNDIVSKLLKLIEIMSTKIMCDQSQQQTYIETMGHICDTLYIILSMQDEAVSLLLNLTAALFDSQNQSFQKLGVRLLKEFCSTNEDRVVYDDTEVEQLVMLSIKMFTMLEIFDEHELSDLLTAEDPSQLFQDQSIQSIIQEAIYEGRDRFNDVIIPALRKFCDIQSQQPEFHQVAISLVVLSILSQREQVLFDQYEIFKYIQVSFISDNQLVLYYSILALQQLTELFSCDNKFVAEVILFVKDRSTAVFLKYSQISYIVAEVMNLYGKIFYSLTPNQSKDILDQSYEAVITTIDNQSLFVQTSRMTLLEFIIEKFAFKIQLQFVQLELSRDFQLVQQYGASLSQQLNKTQQTFFIQLLHCTSYLISCYSKQNILQASQIEQLCSFVYQLCISQLADLQHEYRDVCMFAINVLFDEFATFFVNVIPQIMDIFFQILNVDSFGKQESITGESHYLRHIEDQKKDIYQICKKFIIKQPQIMLHYSNNLRNIICKDTAFWFGRSPQLEVLCELPRLFIYHNLPRSDITSCVEQVLMLLQQKVLNSKTFCSCEDVSALISCLQSLICVTDVDIMQKVSELFSQLIQFLYENYSRRLTEAKQEAQISNNLNLIRQISLDIRQSNEGCGILFYGYCKLLLAETQNIQLLSILDQKMNVQVSQILPYKSCTTRILCKHVEYQQQTAELIRIKMQIYANKSISYQIDVLLFIDILESIDTVLLMQIYESAKAKHHLQDLVLALKIALKMQNQEVDAISDLLVKAQETMNDHIYTVLFNTLQSLESAGSVILTRIVSVLLNFNIGVKQDQSDMQVLISLLPKCDQQLLYTLLTPRALQTMQQFQQ